MSQHAIADTPDIADIAGGLDAMEDGIGIFDADRVLLHANRSFLTAFECLSSLGRQFTYGDFVANLARSGEIVLPLSAEHWITVELSQYGTRRKSEYLLADGRTLELGHHAAVSGGLTVVLRDVTAAKSLEAMLRRTKAEAETSNETKSRFLRAANHDLRQPLSTLKILIFSCMQEQEEEHRRDLLHAMDISVSIMEDLLGALLQIGQLDAGQIVPRVSTFQLSQIFERIGLQFRHQARERGLKLRFVQTRATVVSDKALLERILTNLVANAIRYTDVGGVVVGCRRSGSGIRVEVWDSGKGIAEQHKLRIFDEFYQINHDRHSRKKGLGLGLNIVQRLAGLLGHRVGVRSVEGSGSVFSIEMPIGDVWQSDTVASEVSEMVGGEFAGTPVLVIEDDAVLQDAMRELLERWGFRVTAVQTEEDALEVIANAGERPALIIADYSLRGQFGTDVLQKIMAAAGGHIPALIVTADVEPRIISEIQAAGLPVLIKPISPPRLRVMMHNLLFEPGSVRAGRPE